MWPLTLIGRYDGTLGPGHGSFAQPGKGRRDSEASSPMREVSKAVQFDEIETDNRPVFGNLSLDQSEIGPWPCVIPRR